MTPAQVVQAITFANWPDKERILEEYIITLTPSPSPKERGDCGSKIMEPTTDFLLGQG